MYYKFGKRIFDITLSLIALVILSPLLLIVGLLIRIKLGSPIIFKQNRPGKDDIIFKMYKFRTMNNKVDKNGNLLPDELRLNTFGKMLRSTSLDELPELFNIIKGDMSIVGPRPQLIEDLAFMTDEQRKRHSVRQGLTGLAQVNGRNAISWEMKFLYDLQYINNITFIGDLRIMLLTIVSVFKKENISMEGMETAENLGDYLLRTKFISESYYNDCLSKYNLRKS